MDPDRNETLDLLRRWHGGENAALDELVRRNLSAIREEARRRLGPSLRRRGETVDYVQDALVELLRYGPRFMPESGRQFRALVAKIIVNVLRDKHDFHSAKRRAISVEQPLGDSLICIGSPSVTARRAETEALIRLALELLEPDDRNVIVLREYDGLTFDEIGDRLGIAESTVRLRFTKAMPRLRTAVRQIASGDVDDLIS